MRELKFRAWDEEQKIMHYDFQWVESGEDYNDWIVFISDKQKLTDIPHPLNNPYFSQQFKIMQYTGLKDKLGKEIYEGDILKWPKQDELGVIYYDINGCQFRIKSNEHTLHMGLNIGRKGLASIIGNIYENPELLKTNNIKNLIT